MRKIAIVAKNGTSTLAPWQDESWEVWGMPWISYPRCDVYFDMHNQVLYDEHPEPDSVFAKQEWIDLIDKQPVYCLESRLDKLPNSVEFPIDRVNQSIPIHYYENSIAYLIGLAQGLGIEVIIPPGNPLMMSVWEDGRYGIGNGKRPIHPQFFARITKC